MSFSNFPKIIGSNHCCNHISIVNMTGNAAGWESGSLQGWALGSGIRRAGSHPACPALSVCEVHPSCFISSWFYHLLLFPEPESAKTTEETCKVGDFIENSPGDIFSPHGSPHLRLYHECHWTSQGSPLKLIIKNYWRFQIEGFKTDASKTRFHFINAPRTPSTSIRNFVIYAKVH